MTAFTTQLLPTHNNKAMYDKTLSDLGCETMYFIGYYRCPTSSIFRKEDIT